MSAITLLSSTRSGVASAPIDTERGTTSNFLSSKFRSFTTSRPEKMKSEPKLPTETCNLSSSQSRFFSIPKSIVWTPFTQDWAKTTIKKSCQPFATKFSEPSSLSFLPPSSCLKEIKYLKESETFCQKELHSSTS